MEEDHLNKKYLYQLENLKKDDTDIGQIILDIQNHIKDQESFAYDQKILEKKNFIITENSIERIRKISYYVSRGVPVLLEGPSGTSKTFSTEFACLVAKTKRPLIRFNMSSDTVPSDLLGKMVGDKNSLAGISSQEGHFLKAFKYGHPLLLDEINLASQAVLQCIEEALDSEVISIEIPGFPLKEIKKHPDFSLIATQNPNKGLFANKRQNLGKKFMSKFQVITFPEFTEDELNKIAIGLGKSFGFKGDNKILEDLVKFHKKWASSEEIKDDVQCFTVREIAASVKAFSEGSNLYDTVMTIYGARYQKSLKDKLSALLRSYDSFKNIKPDELTIPNNFPNCFKNNSLLQAIKSIKFSLDNNRHVIISGNEGAGKTQLALWFAEWYIKEKNIEKSNIFYCLCTEELKCPDLIGRQSPTNNTDPGKELIEWKNGFLSIAIENGGVVVLDALDQASATVTERLNGLLDQKYDDTEKAKFDVPENPQKPEILIHKNFRLVCTTDINKINQMSPAFVNRFDVIVLEDQMEGIREEEKKELIKFLLINSYNENKVKSIISKQESQEKENEENVVDTDLENLNFNQEEETPNINENEENNNENFDFGDDGDQQNQGFNFDEDNQEQEGGNLGDNNLSQENVDKRENKINDKENSTNNKDNNTINNEGKKDDKEEIEEETYQPSEELINLVFKKSNDFKTIYKLNQFCRTIRIFIIHFKEKEEISEESIVNFCYNILTKDFEKDKLVEIDPKIEKILLDLKDEPPSDDPKYFYKNSKLLSNYIAVLHACKIANIHLCVYGPPGAGKTSGTRAFGRIISKDPNKRFDFEMHSFHAGTKPNHYYGTTTLKEGKICYKNGTLTNSLISGYMFIADELNLSSVSNMKALAPALEMNLNHSIYFPGIENPINIHPNFFFVVCQNEVGTIGRNTLPSNIIRRFKEIFYPPQQVEDIAQICKEINSSLYKVGEDKVIDDNTARKLGEFMIKLNNENFSEISQWSLRDINKLFQRQIQQSKDVGIYKGITFCHNLYFYTLSSVSKEEIPNVKEKVLKIIQEVFGLSLDDRNNLSECFNSKAELKNDNQGSICIYKGNCCINFEKFKQIFTTADKPNIEENPIMKLTSLLEDLFQISLASDKEPILLIGPSGYKTFLAQKFLSNAKTITLNQESSVEQLLGASSFFAKSEVKDFYLRLIVLICRLSNYIELNEKLKNGTLTKEEINRIIDEKKKDLPLSFHYAIEKSRDKIFMEKKEDDETNALSNMIIEFRPGLFLTAILGGSCLILKNLSNLPTIILERFNELFSGKCNITVNEDIPNTITPESNKELSEFNKNFRVFGTCPPGATSQLSEAVISRFSLIYVGEYALDEQKTVLQSYCDLNKLDTITDGNINDIIEFSQSLNTTFSGINFTLFQMINLLQLAHNINIKLNKSGKYPLMTTDIVLVLIIYYSARGLLDNRDSSTLKRICDIVNLRNPPEEGIEKYVSPIYIDEEDGVKGVRSKITHLIIKSPFTQNIEKNIAFTPQFNEMIEIIHFGLSNNVPVILEGMPGQGKQLCINYISEILGYEVVNIMISQSTKVEDLLGKNIITKDKNKNIKVILNETKLSRALKKQKDENNKGRELIFIFNNLNNASPAVLELLTSIFDKNQQNVLLPDGSTIHKNPINIIGILKPQNGANKDKLPPTLLYSSLYHIVLEPDEEAIKMVIEKKLEKEKFKGDSIKLFDNYIKAKDIIEKKYQKENFLNFNDISKFINFRQISYGKINDVSIIFAMVFVYRFTEQEIINDLKEELQIQSIDMKPTLIYDMPIGTLTYKIGENNKIQINTFFNRPLKPEEIQDFKNCFLSLTSNQKSCILFLILCALTKRSCLIQGETASGKSHVIRAFAYLMGKGLNVYQLNSESSTSLLSGQSKLNTKITKEEYEELSKIFKNLESFGKLKDKINERFKEGKYEEWTGESFKELIDNIKDTELRANDDEIKILKSSRKEIGKIIIPANRFNNDCDSAFVISMKDGYWDLFDGIESATPQLSEKISTLAGEDPELDLYETGKDKYFFTRKNDLPNSTKIHDDFLMFICHNISSQSDKSLDPSLLSKCICFCMPPVDSKEIDSAQVLYGSLIKNNLDRKICQSSATRLSFVHKFVKDKSRIEEDSFSGDLQPTGRTLGFIGKEFKKYLNSNTFENPNLEIYRPVCHSLISFYANSYNPVIKNEEGKTIILEEDRNKKELKLKDKFVDDLVSTFKNYVPDFNLDDVSQSEKYLDILLVLKKIQEYAVSTPETRKKVEFNFSGFVSICLEKIELGEIELIINHLSDTVELLSKMEMPDPEKDLYYQINILNKLFKDINSVKNQISDQYIGRKLSDKELLQIDELKVPFSRLYLFEELNKNKEIFTCNVKSNIFKYDLTSLINCIMELYNEKTSISFIKMLELLKMNPELFTIMELIFPYKHFYNTAIKNITYLINLITTLYLSKINFIFKIDNKSFIFQTNKNPLKMMCTLVTNNKFILAKDTKLERALKKGDKPIILFKIVPALIKDPNKDHELWNYYIYSSILDIIKNKKEESVDQNSIKKIITQYKSKNSEPELDKNFESFNISRFFDSNDKSSLFGKAWGCVLNFGPDFLNYIKCFCYKVESHLINLATFLNQIIEPKYIEPIIRLCESMKEFCSKNSILWQIHTGQFNPESSKATIYNNIIKSEKVLVDNVFNQEIQFNENIKADFQNCFSEAQKKIDDLLLVNEKDEKLRKIKQILNENKTKLSKINPKDNKILIVKNQLNNYISQYSDNQITLTEEIVNDITEKVNHFIELSKQTDIDKKDNLINWPDCLVKHQNFNETENTNKLDLIIWYSKIMKELKLIDSDIKNNLLKCVMKLNENQEILSIINLLMNINNDKISNIDRKNKQIIYGTLNAFFIYKLYKQSKATFIWEIDEYINNFKKREEINDPYLIYKVDEYLKSLEDKFVLYIPKFKKSDLLFLFINVIKNDCQGNKGYKLGPILEEFHCNQVISSLSPMVDKLLEEGNNKSSIEILDDISKVIYLNYLNNDGKEEDIKDHNSITSSLKNIKVICETKIEELKSNVRNKEDEIFRQKQKIKASEIILSLFDLAKLMDDKFPECKLEFDDIELFNNKLDDRIINQYPSLFYFLNKNLFTYQKIKENFDIAYKSKKLYDEQNEFHQSFYFWIFGLRVISSMNCIYLDQFNEDFRVFISNEAKKLIQDKLNKGENFGAKWINILLDKVDSQYEDNNIILIYKYIKKIIGYISDVRAEFKEEAINLLKNVLVEILKLVFNDTIDDFLNKNVKNSDKLMEFFINPDLQLKKEIEKNVNKTYKEVRESELYVKDLKPFYDSFINNFSTYKQDIKNEIDKEKKFTEDKFIKEKEQKREGEIKDKTDIMTTLIENYKKKYEEITNTFENSLLLKTNDILRKMKNNKNISIEQSIEDNKIFLEDFEKLNEFIEKETNNNTKKLVSEIVTKFKDSYQKLININNDYNKYKPILQFLQSKKIKCEKDINNNNIQIIENNIQEHINFFSKYENNDDEELKKTMNEKLKIFENLFKDVKDIEIIYNNYKCDLESAKYLEESKKLKEKLDSLKTQKEQLNNEINKKNLKNQENKQKIEDLNNKINELKENNIEEKEQLENEKQKNEENINSSEKEINKLNNKLKELENNISELENKSKLKEEMSKEENKKKQNIKISETRLKSKENEINEKTIENEINSIINFLRNNSSELIKIINDKLKPIEKYVTNSNLIFEEIKKQKYLFLLKEYKIFTDIFNKINDIKKNILDLFTEESINILFSQESHKVLYISYTYPDGDKKDKQCQIYDIFSNSLMLNITTNSGNIFLNQKYYNDQSKVIFYHKGATRSPFDTGHEIEIINFNKIDDSKINEAIDKSLEEIKLYDYKKDCPNLQFGTGQNLKNENEFYKMLDEYYDNIQKLNEIFKSFDEDKVNKNMEGIKKIIGNIKEITDNLFLKTKELNNHFKVEFSSTLYSCLGTQKKINDLSDKISMLNEHIHKLLSIIENKKLINKINKLKNIKKGYKFFKKNLKLFLPIDKSLNKKVDFRGLDENSDLLKLPIISIVNNEVSCSYPNLKLNFGPYISSLYEDPIKINFTSLVKDLSMNIKNVEKEKHKNLLKCYVDNANGLAQLKIIIPKMNQFEKDKEVVNLKCQIQFNSPGATSYLLDCEFNIEIIPFYIIAYCDEFNLAKIDNENYTLCVTQIQTGKSINIYFKNYNINKELEFSYKIESLENNTSEKPEIKKSKEHLELILGSIDEKEMKRLKCQLFINFYNSFNLNINIDCYLIPFDFKFEVYDYNSNSYKDNIEIYIKGIKNKCSIRPNKFPLHFRVILPDYPFEGDVEFSHSQRNYIIINNNNVPKHFKNSFTFDLELKIDDNIIKYNNQSQYLKENNFNLKLKLINKTHEISIKLKRIENLIKDEKFVDDYNNRFNIEKCLFDGNKEIWKKEQLINNEKKCDLKATYVSIFGLEQLYYIKYELYNSNDKKNKYLYVSSSENHLLIIEFKQRVFNAKIDFKDNNEKICYYDYNNFGYNIGIIGYIGNSEDLLWYPAFYKYDDYFENLYEQTKCKDNIKYQDNLNEIIQKYESNADKQEIKGSYSILAYRIAKTGVAYKDKTILTDLFKEIKKFFNNQKDILKEILDILEEINNSKDKDYNSVYKEYFNTIYLLYKAFKKRYKFIKSLGFTIISSYFDEQKINEKSDELLNKYFTYDKSKALDKSYIMKSFSMNKDIKSSKELFTKLPSPQKKSIIFKEPNNSFLSDNTKTDYSLSKTSLDIGNDLGNIRTFKTEIIQDIIYPSEWSIISLNDFFMKSIKNTRELPLFAINSKKENNENSLNRTEEMYVKLLNIYEETPEEDDSFIGELVLTFNDQFTKMTNNLLNSKIMFKEGILPKKFKLNIANEANKQYIIAPKEVIANKLNENQWETNINTNRNAKNSEMSSQIFSSNLHLSIDNIIGTNKDLMEREEKFKKEKEKLQENEQRKFYEKQKTLKREESKIFENVNKEKEGEEKSKKEIKKTDLISDFKIKIKKNRRKSSDTETINLNKDKSNIPSNDNNKTLEINTDTSIKKENIKMDVSNFNFNDEILLTLVIERMREIENKIKNNKPLPELGIKKDLKGQPDYRNEKPASNNFNVIELYQRGMSLANKIVKNISKKKIPFSHISVNLLIDCSGFISIENKLKQFVIICGIVNALNIVNISYAISIVGDSQFECTLKPFDLEHSLENLQKVLDCLFIKRFVGKNANAIQYAIKLTKANSTYRMILMFTDGLDEDFLLIESWKNLLSNYINFSFGFFFINSENISNKHSEDLDYLKVKWNEFKKQIRDNGINIELLYYNSTFESSSKLYDDIADIVSNLLERPIDEEKIPNKDDSDFTSPTFDLSQEENLKDILLFENALEENYENKSDIYLKKTEVLKNITNKVCKLNVNPYKNKLSKIIKYDIKDENIKKVIHSYAKKYIQNRTKLNKAKIEAIFKPNKPSQKVLSTTGTEFDIPALIMNLINPSPEPMIYLEEKGGMIRNYSVSLILDTSNSCFNPLCNSFSLQTLRLILSTLNYIDIPCFDFILSRQTNPEILCSNLSSVRAINAKSIIWESLISILAHPCSKSDLASAIEAAFDLKRMRSSEYTSYLFILTDGLYQENEYKRILRAVNNCVKSGLNVFGIGIGVYPVRIENLFPKVIYCHNPYNINKAIANFFGESISGVKDSMTFINKEELNHTIILNNKIAEIIKNSNNSTNLNYQTLYNKLNEVIVETDAFLLISNPEDDMEDTGGEIKSNPTGEGKELLKKDQLKGHKILIVMLWSKTLNPDENQCIHKDYLTKVSPQSEACLKDALDFLGITIDIVENYRDTIEKLTSKNENGKCPYYGCWIINGPPYEDLPDGSKEAFLFGQFLEILKLFWEAGGALVFLAEGWKLQYQTNEFLKILDFDGKKINFYLVGDDEEKGTKEHKGGKYLSGDRTGQLKSKQQFSKKIERYGIMERLRLDHNLFTLFEGDTICYASTDDYNKLSPFHPFSRDSENGISSLFYLSDEKKRGDIFIDCGFTKLFINMKKDDTAFRYFQNIASWSARPEYHLFFDKIDVKDWRPEGINYSINVNKKWTNFLEKKPKKIDLMKLKTLFAFDNSGSIGGNAVYFNEISRIIHKYYKNGDKFFLWENSYTEKTKSQIDIWIQQRRGSGGTNSANIAHIANICPTHREHLIIVTDGEVSEKYIKQCDVLMNQYNIKFKFVSVYVIGSGGNLSVGAPFCRGCPNRTIHVLNAKKRINGPSLSLDEIAASKRIPFISTILEFDSIYDKIYSYIKAMQLGKNENTDLKNQLLSLKSRIIGNLSGTKKTEFETKWGKLYEMACNGVHDFKIGTAGIK